MIEFEWDKAKAFINEMKHGVSFEEAKSVFYDILSVTVSDSDHSHKEFRFITIGSLKLKKVLVVSHTDRNDKIRIISARRATKKERMNYEEY